MSCIDHGQKGQGLGYGTYRYRGVRAVLSGKIRVAYQVMQAYMVECGL